jgi:hypothetical protein
MTTKLQAIRGMNDLLAGELPYWLRVEAAARELFADYGYREMRVPSSSTPTSSGAPSASTPTSSRRKCTASTIAAATA